MNKVFALVAIFFAAWAGAHVAFAQDARQDSNVLTDCIAKVGLNNAARESNDGGCVGLVREPCLPPAANTAESNTCLSREDAAWVVITDKALAEIKTKRGGKMHTQLKRRRTAWIKAISTTCAPEEEGTLAGLESEYCEQTEVAKLAVEMMRAAKP